MSEFLTDKLKCLSPYTPGEQPKQNKYVKLNTNENPYSISRYSSGKINAKTIKNLRLYSDPENYKLSAEIAAYYGVNSKNVLPTNGSDEALAFVFAAFCPRGAIFPDVTYGFYKVFAQFFGISYKEITLNHDFTVDIKPYINCKKTVFLANPNAQTGIYLPLNKIEEIVKSNPASIIVLDEAYIDFGGESAVKLINKYKNLVVIQTFSKSRSLAGARVGFVIADDSLINDLKRVKYSFNPYNVNSISQCLAVAAIKDRKYFKKTTQKIIASRQKLTDGLTALDYCVLPSSANFVLCRSSRIFGGELYQKLKKRGFLVRHFDDRRINEFVRISVGTDKQINLLLREVKRIEEEL